MDKTKDNKNDIANDDITAVDLSPYENKQSTIKDVARIAGVSIATVSYVLNDKVGQSISEQTRKKVLQVANMLNYKCNALARYLSKGVSNVITVKLNSCISSPAYTLELISRLASLMRADGYSVSVSNYDGDSVPTSEPAAIVTIGITGEKFLEYANEHFVPVIAVDTIVNKFLFYQINDDFDKINSLAAKALNTDKICYITKPVDDLLLERMKESFHSVAVVRDYTELLKLDANTVYAASDEDYALVLSVQQRLFYRYRDGAAAKAQALHKCILDAINRTSVDSHDISV